MSARVKERTKIALALLIFILGILLTSWYSYAQEKAKINKEIDNKLLCVAKSVPLVLDEGFHSGALKKESVDSAQDMQNIQKLTRYAESVGVKYVYTAILKDGVLRFTSSSATKEELATGRNLTRYFDKYDDADSRLFDAFREREIFFASYQDKWGSFRSVFVPFVSPSGDMYVVGADIEIGFIDALLRKSAIKWFAEAFVVFSCSAPLVFIYQAALRRRNRRLAQQVEAATKELRELNASLEQKVLEETERNSKQERIISEQLKMAQMGDMMRSIAHHWRQPLTALGLFVQDVAITHESGELDDKYIDGFKTKSMEIIHSMSKTIDDFRDFFKSSYGKEEFFVENAVYESLELLTPQFQDIGIETIVGFEAQKHAVTGYKNELKQVLLSLLSNAKDAVVAGGGEKRFVRVHVSQRGELIDIEIEDSGGGIPAEVIGRIFEPYFTTKEQGKGAGLGLYMAKEIVERHLGGSIGADNIDGGARFTVTIPKEI